MAMILRLIAAILIALPFMQTSGLTSDERSLGAYIDAHNHEALALLERVVNINSGTQNFEGVREVGRAFRAPILVLPSFWLLAEQAPLHPLACEWGMGGCRPPAHTVSDLVGPG